MATVTLNPALDLTLTVGALVPDTKTQVLSSRRDPGGGGINVSRMLANLGIRSRAIVVAGGAIGDELLSLVEAENSDGLIEVVPVPIESNTRENVSVIDRTSGEQYRMVVPGPDVGDADALLASVRAAIGDAEFVVLSGGLPPAVDASVYRRLAESLDDRIVVVDALEPAVVADVFDGWATVAKPNIEELESVVDVESRSVPALVGAARAALARGRIEAALVSLGGRGALLVPADGCAILASPPPVGVVSTTGAGDSMVAGVVASMHRGDDMVEAVRLGVAAGAATVEVPGTGLGSAAAVRRLISAVRVERVEEAERLQDPAGEGKISA